jgi:hypothetical protein
MFIIYLYYTCLNILIKVKLTLTRFRVVIYLSTVFRCVVAGFFGAYDMAYNIYLDNMFRPLLL